MQEQTPPPPCSLLGHGPQEALSCSDQCWRARPCPHPVQPGLTAGNAGGLLCNQALDFAKAA